MGRWLVLAAVLILLNLALWWIAQPNLISPSNDSISSEQPSSQGSSGDQVPTMALSNEASTLVENATEPVNDVVESNQTPNEITQPELPSSVISNASNPSASEEQPNGAQSSVQTDSTGVTIVKADDVIPGTVEISEVFLDDDPASGLADGASQPLSSANPALSANSQDLSDVSPQDLSPNVIELDDQQTLEDTLVTSVDLTTRVQAFKSLAQIWDTSFSEPVLNPFCQDIALQGLRCLDVATLDQLRQLNRPTIVVLSHRDRLHRAIVDAVSDQTVTIRVGQRRLVFEDSVFNQYWNGNAVAFWRPGNFASGVLTVGSSDSSVPQARQELDAALAAFAMPRLDNATGDEFDLDMSQKLFALQSRFGLQADSVLGLESKLFINEVLRQTETPVLRSRLGR